MRIEFETYYDAVVILPVIAVDYGAGIEIQIGWLCWGFIISIG